MGSNIGSCRCDAIRRLSAVGASSIPQEVQDLSDLKDTEWEPLSDDDYFLPQPKTVEYDRGNHVRAFVNAILSSRCCGPHTRRHHATDQQHSSECFHQKSLLGRAAETFQHLASYVSPNHGQEASENRGEHLQLGFPRQDGIMLRT